MKIKVTQHNIDKGTPKYGTHCPVAHAITEATGRLSIVGRHSVWFMGGDEHVELPCEAQYFIIAYDRGCDVSPFEFDFDYELPPKLTDMNLPAFKLDDMAPIQLVGAL
jgi:hypothetical protein